MSISLCIQSSGFRLVALVLTLSLLAASCGDDDDSDVSSEDTAADSDTTSDGAGEGDGSEDSAAPSGSCGIVAADDVAAAAEIEVASTTESTGSGSYQEIEYSTIGCTYEVADGGSVKIVLLTDEMGAQLPADVFSEIKAESEARSLDNFPHEDVPELAKAAFFPASLGPSDSLIIDASPSGVIEIRNHRELLLDREALKAVGEAAVQAYN